MLLKEIITEKKDSKSKNKPVFIETDIQSPFPDDTMSVLKKSIKKESKDLTKTWKNAVAVVEFTFQDLKIPKPGAFLKKRWDQYLSLIQVAVQALADARGFKGSWRTT